ncbi:MAG TPA: hypothetical protein VEZ47_03985 [Gemmatirosa sp.]|nr:hypothetical protein [Gemmatirosa sp.]
MKRSALVPMRGCALLAACADPTATRAPSAGDAALAAKGTGNPKFSRKDTGCTPTSDGSVTCAYKITGLGNTDVVFVTIAADVRISADCQNPGGNVAPGQAYTTSASQTFAAPRTDNGQVTGSVTFDFGAVAGPTAASVCPNAKWEVVNVRKSILSYDFFAVVNPDSPSAITMRP